jgi:hypothetical protein
MKTAKVNFKGKEYTTCFSLYVIAKCESKSSSFESVLEEVNGNKISTAIWLFAQMLKAGELYDKANGENPPAAPTYDELLITTSVEDISNLVLKGIADTIDAGSEREVEVDPKNAETTQGK